MGDFSLAVLSLAACVFAASAGAKLKSRKAYSLFRDGLAQTRLLPGQLRSAGAAVLSGTETVIAAGLIVAAALTAAGMPGAIPVAGFALASTAFLTSVLAAGIALVIRRGTRAPCPCFGTAASRPLGWTHLVRNLSLLALVCIGLAGVPPAPEHPAAASAIVAACSGALGALLFIRWDDLVELFAPIQPFPGATPGQRADHRHD
jgi:hypothetical protein